jgi:MFS family permease
MAETRTASQEWREGWTVVVACMGGMTLLGMGFLTIPTFFAPLEHQFGWSRGETTSAFLVYAGASIFLAPLVGTVLDRWGVRRLALPGCVLVSVAWALFATLNGSIVQWLLLWLFLASACQMIMVTVWSAAVSSYFTVSRGLALAVTMGANGGTQLIAPNLTNYLIDTEGWRAAFVIMGLGWGAAVTLLCFFLLKDRRAPQQGVAAGQPAAEVPGYTVREGVRSASFVKIIAAVFLCYMLTIALMIHLVPLLGSRGLSRDQAVWIYSSLGITGALANVASGYLVDRLPAKPLAAALVALPAIACILLLQPSTSFWQRAIAANVFGIAAGGQMPALVYLATRHFGLRSFGTLFGFVGSAMAVATAVAPVLAGLLFDRTHSYTLFLTICIPLALAGGLVVFSLGRYPPFASERDTAQPGDPRTA